MKALTLDQDKLTAGDLETIEEYTGVPAGTTLHKFASGTTEGLLAKEFVAVLFLAGRQADPNFTLEQAKETPFSAIEVSAPNPTRAAKAASAKRSPR